MPQWISQGIAKAQEGKLEPVVKATDKGQEGLVAQGYEVERTCRVEEGHGPREWQERVLVIHSPAHGAQPAKGLDNRLAHAEAKIRALPPAKGHRRQDKVLAGP